MAHHIYTTEGFVVGLVPYGESNMFVRVLTRDLGLVGASARSVRDVKSKLRYGLQEFCLSSVSLVRGKHEWKITNAVPHKNFWHECADKPDAMRVCAHVFGLLKKLVAGEERNEALFDIVHEGISFITDTPLSFDELRKAECMLVLRIVHNLGYVKPTPTLAPFVEHATWDTARLQAFVSVYAEALKAVNDALRESQL